jgi:regulator of protease activity HflC (stomatin/prohibitin superfamily)
MLMEVSVQRMKDLQEEMQRAIAEGKPEEELLELQRAFQAQTADFQERAVEVSRATHEVKAALAEAAFESSRLRSDALKQQATFAGAALVGTAAVAERLLPKEQVAQPLLWASYGILLVTVCASLLLLHLEAWSTERALATGERQPRSRLFRATHWASMAGLPLAVLAFVAFAALNVL